MTIIRTIVLLMLLMCAVSKTKAYKTPHGNFDVQTTCPKNHTGFKRRGDKNTYTCPYCGLDMC